MAHRAWILTAACLAGLGSTGGCTTANPSCVCDVALYSEERWMAGSWGLECKGHGGHGDCSTKVDRAHGAGCGAMTGKITLRTANDRRLKSCPDDHHTCFRGPAPCDDGGSWANVCSCDTVHCTENGGSAAFDCGEERDDTLVLQAVFKRVDLGGPCGSSPVTLEEVIEENDPVCCDDRLGILRATFYPTAGAYDERIATEATNCDNGSTRCGSFGATLKLRATCTAPARN